MAKQNETKYYMVTYSIPIQTGTIQIEAESPEAAARAFEKTSLNKLFRLAEFASGDEPLIDSMLEYEDAVDFDVVAKEVDLKALAEAGYGMVIA